MDSVIAMSDSAGNLAEGPYIYDAYGNGPPTTGVPFKFTGRRLDPETGLYYYRARYYSAALGRFLQTDPIGYGDDLVLYKYAGDDPVNMFDPSGEDDSVDTVYVTASRDANNSGALTPFEVGFEIPLIAQLTELTNGIQINVPSVAPPQQQVAADEHTKNARPSAEEKHEKGQARKQKDRGNEKGDKTRGRNRVRPKKWKGPWPPKTNPFSAPCLVAGPEGCGSDIFITPNPAPGTPVPSMPSMPTPTLMPEPVVASAD